MTNEDKVAIALLTRDYTNALAGYVDKKPTESFNAETVIRIAKQVEPGVALWSIWRTVYRNMYVLTGWSSIQACGVDLCPDDGTMPEYADIVAAARRVAEALQ